MLFPNPRIQMTFLPNCFIKDLKQNDKHWYNVCSLLVLSCSKFLPQLARGYLWPVPGNQFMVICKKAKQATEKKEGH